MVAVAEKSVISPEILSKLDEVEKTISLLPAAEIEIRHHFIPGVYVREMLLPAKTVLTSKIHKTNHGFAITKGCLAVWTEDGGVQYLRAPFSGMTRAGTKRIGFSVEDTIWMTFHITDKVDLSEIEKDVIEPHVNPLLSQCEKERIAP